MRVHPSITLVLCLFIFYSANAQFNPFGPTFNPFPNLHHDFFSLRQTNDSPEDIWPFGGTHSRDKLGSDIGASGIDSGEVLRTNPGRDTEPLDIDFVKGPIANPDDAGLGNIKPPSHTAPHESSGFNGEAHFPGTSFNHHFGNFFNNQFFGSFPGFQFFDFPRYEPWWKGPNVCKVREEDTEDETESNEGDKTSSEVEIKDDAEDTLIQAFQLNLETCVEKTNKYQCKKIMTRNGKKSTFTVTYKCCNGFARKRAQENPNGQCVKLDLAPIDNTIEQLGAKEFMASAKRSINPDEMDGMTIFAPVDASFHDFSERMFEDQNLVVVPLNKRERRDTNDIEISNSNNEEGIRDLVHAHMVKGLIDIEDIENEQLLVSEYNNSTIRLNIFPRPPGDRKYDFPYHYTANCVPIVKPNQLASNGMVHMVKGVLVPPEKTVMEMLKERPDMAVLSTVLERTKLDKVLMDPNRHVTLFAPTDRAFEKLDPQLRKKLKEGRGCAANILRNHILDLTFCSSAIAMDAKTSAYNLLGEKLEMEMADGAQRRDGNEIADMTDQHDLMINGESRIMEADLMGVNGVIHVIDSILPTESAQPVTSTLSQHNSSIMTRLLEAGNLADYIDDTMNTTFFAPTDKAFEQSETGKKWLRMLEEEPDQLKNNLQLKRFVDYHMVQPMIKTSNLREGMIKTASDNDLRVNLYSTNFPFMHIMNRATVNCARLVHFDEDSCGSVVHQIDKVLEAPENNLLQQLESNEKYSEFLRLIRESNLTSLLEDQSKGMTLLVPSNDLFKEVEEYLSELQDKEGQVEHLIKSHIIPEVLCCAGITQSQWPFVRSIEALSHAHLQLNRDRRPKVQNAGISKCDIMATNGIIHEINDLIAATNRQQQPDRHDFRQDFFFKK